MTSSRRYFSYAVLATTILLSWEYFGTASRSVRVLLSSPSLIAAYASSHLNDLLVASGTTLLEAVLGLVLATSGSFLVLYLCILRPRVMEFLLPLMIASQVIPLIVLAPFFVIAFGIGTTSKVAMSALLCFFPTFVNGAQGYRSIDRNTHDLLLVYNASNWVRIKKAYFPLALPSVMAGLKVSATLAVIGAIVAEFTGAEVGLGKNLFISAIRLDPDLMMASLVLATVLGAAMYGAIHTIERVYGGWYRS